MDVEQKRSILFNEVNEVKSWRVKELEFLNSLKTKIIGVLKNLHDAQTKITSKYACYKEISLKI